MRRRCAANMDIVSVLLTRFGMVWLVDHSHLFDLISVAILVWSPQLSQKGASLKLIMTKPDTLFSMIRLEALLVDLAWEANSIRQGHCLRYHC